MLLCTMRSLFTVAEHIGGNLIPVSYIQFKCLRYKDNRHGATFPDNHIAVDPRKERASVLTKEDVEAAVLNGVPLHLISDFWICHDLVHELYHVAFPGLTEDEVASMSLKTVTDGSLARSMNLVNVRRHS